MESPKHILALAPNWLGDVAMCTPALRTLKRRFPDARLTVAGTHSACLLLEGLSFIDRLVPFPARPRALAMLQIARELRPYARDLAIVFPHSFRAALLARLAGSRRILGSDRGGRRWLLTDKVTPHREGGAIAPVYMTWEYLDLLAPLGCEYDGFGLELVASERDIASIKEHLVGPRPVIGFAPGAAFGPSKRWPAERYAAVSDRLVDEVGATCVLLCGPDERDTREAVQSAAKHRLVECDEGQPTIGKMKATIKNLDSLICNDSGPRHVAVAMGVPTVTIMGPTMPAYSCGPYERGEVLRVDVDCGPCQQPICKTDHRCMTRIEVERVVHATRVLLPRAPV